VQESTIASLWEWSSGEKLLPNATQMLNWASFIRQF
jgi:hypothetical protein